MAIKEKITLEGAEEIKGTLAGLGAAGEDFIKKLNAAGGGVVPFADLGEAAKKAGDGLDAATRPANNLRNALYVLRPIVRELGVSMGMLGSLSRLAGVGFAGMAVAGAGALVVEMVKLGESASNALKQLQGLFESNQQGQKSFDQMQGAARNLGTSIDTLLPIVQKFELARQKFGEGTFKIVSAPEVQELQSAGGAVTIVRQGLEDTTKAADNFYAAIRAGATSEAQAKTASAQFADELYRTGKVTGDMIRNLRLAGIDTRELVSILQIGQTDSERFAKDLDKIPLSLQRLLFYLDRAKPAAKTFDRTFSDAFGNVSSSWGRAIAGPAGLGILVTGIMDAFASMGKAVEGFFQAATWTAGWEQIKQNAAGAWADIRAIFSVNPFSADLWLPIWNGLWTDIKSLGQLAWNAIKEIYGFNPFDLTEWATRFSALWETVKLDAQAAWNWIKNLFSQTIKPKIQFEGVPGAAANTTTAGSGGSYFEPPVSGFSSGGLFRGRPGMDTNLAWLTHLEYIMNPAAVKKYGIDFMHMINSLQFPIRGFAGGGLNLAPIGISSPSISAMQSSRSLTLVLDTKRFNISGSRSTIDALEREAAMRGLAATGPAPGWVR